MLCDGLDECLQIHNTQCDRFSLRYRPLAYENKGFPSAFTNILHTFVHTFVILITTASA